MSAPFGARFCMKKPLARPVVQTVDKPKNGAKAATLAPAALEMLPQKRYDVRPPAGRAFIPARDKSYALDPFPLWLGFFSSQNPWQGQRF